MHKYVRDTIIYFCNFPGRIRPSQIHRNRPSYCVVSSFAVVLSWIHFNRSGFSHVRCVEVFLRGLHVSARQQADSGEQRQLLRQSGIDWVSSFRGPLLLDWEEVSEIAILLCVFSRCALIVHKKNIVSLLNGIKNILLRCNKGSLRCMQPINLTEKDAWLDLLQGFIQVILEFQYKNTHYVCHC